ncbi:hypothetical protein Patl1_34673 [Pistacia atlantica]|uniref:Uncharacterized protein n=1 Tax=Pistacia atlantica TaxID=434234 RepID=A0ACC0ZSD3_9ROSI|nr:hypothetical protein Patl1_34673 [Pistacia atlantica]
MPSLNVLNLSNNINLKELPSEISKLVPLQRLDISRTAIKELPKELKALSCTRALSLFYLEDAKSLSVFSLADVRDLEVISIAECKKLEELGIDYQRVSWLVFAQNLKLVRIAGCFNLEEIVCFGKLGGDPEIIHNLNPFAKLESLDLNSLQNLKIIYGKCLPFPQFRSIMKRTILSLPPIINGAHSAITLKTKNVFIVYADGKSYVYPDLSFFSMEVPVSYINGTIGISLGAEEATSLLNRKQLSAENVVSCDNECNINVLVPPTRSDVLHPCDVMEDVAIAYGYDNIPGSKV